MPRSLSSPSRHARHAASIVAALVLLASAASADPVRTLAPGVLKVCLFPTFPPFSGQEADGRWTGWDVTFLTGFAAQLGLAFEPVGVPRYAGFWTKPGEDRCDIAAGGVADLPYRRAETGDKGIWSKTYTQVVRAFGVRAEDAGKLSSIADLAGRTVMVVEGSTAEIDLKNRAARAGVALTVIATSDDADNARRVRAGAGPDAPFAYGSGYGSVVFFNDRLGEMALAWPHCLMLADGTLAPERFAFIVRAASTGLAAALDRFIADPAHPYPGGAGPACEK